MSYILYSLTFLVLVLATGIYLPASLVPAVQPLAASSGNSTTHLSSPTLILFKRYRIRLHIYQF